MYSFAEHGEDIVIHRLLNWKPCGTYLDVGAYDPLRMSLTARLANYGWSGINIDIDERVIDKFSKIRKNDINIAAAIGTSDQNVTFRQYQDPVINTVSAKQIMHLDEIQRSDGLFTKVENESQVICRSLGDVLGDCDSLIQDIDFVNLDIEGVELEALKGFPWMKYQPSVFAIEIHKLNLHKVMDSSIVEYMVSQGYRLQSYVFHTCIFVKKDFDEEICHRYSFPSF